MRYHVPFCNIFDITFWKSQPCVKKKKGTEESKHYQRIIRHVTNTHTPPDDLTTSHSFSKCCPLKETNMTRGESINAMRPNPEKYTNMLAEENSPVCQFGDVSAKIVYISRCIVYSLVLLKTVEARENCL